MFEKVLVALDLSPAEQPILDCLPALRSSEIARHAQERDASLIVVGKHGQNWLASTVIGSTAANLCEIAGRPALMVP